MRAVIGGMVLLLVGAAAPAAAQERGTVGVTMGYPSAVGVLWHATDRMALRPEVTFSWSSSEGETTESGGSAFGGGVSALFYLHRDGGLATYVSPRYTFSRTTNEVESLLFGASIETTGRAHTLSGSFGAQYSMHDRFSVFGELGLGYSRVATESAPINPLANFVVSESTSSSVGIRTGVGVVFYF